MSRWAAEGLVEAAGVTPNEGGMRESLPAVALGVVRRIKDAPPLMTTLRDPGRSFLRPRR